MLINNINKLEKMINFIKNVLFKQKKDPAKSKWMTSSIDVEFDKKKFNQKNIFNKISSNSDYGFYYWPYGYLFRYFKWNDVNELGFREVCNFDEIENKYRDYYKIGFFGGSTGFDILVKKKDSIVKKLEDKLNKDTSLTKKYSKFKIINFSQPGNLLFSQILNYVQFSTLINLNMIISHNPSNDYGTSPMNDPIMVKKYKLPYVDMMESFAKRIHLPKNVGIDLDYCDHKDKKNFKPADVKTDVDTIIISYITRLIQFQNMCETSNKIFISGYQPFIFSKKNLSNFEKKKMLEYNPYYKKIYEIIPNLYKRFSYKYEEDIKKTMNFINLHEKFFDLSDKISHFGDTVHLLEPGNEIIAENYYKYIKNLIGT